MAMSRISGRSVLCTLSRCIYCNWRLDWRIIEAQQCEALRTLGLAVPPKVFV